MLGEFGVEDVAARRAYGRFVCAGAEQRPPRPFADAVGGGAVGLGEVGRAGAAAPR